MNRTFILVVSLLLMLVTNTTLMAQSAIKPATKAATIANLEVADMRSWLLNAPMENSTAVAKSVIIIDLPLPNGGTIEMRAVESPVLKGKVASKYPEIKTYTVYGFENPEIYGKITVSPYGLHAYIINPRGGDFYVEPAEQGVINIKKHKTYYVKDGDQFVHGGPDDLFHEHGDGNYHVHNDLNKFAVTKIGELSRAEYEVLFLADDTYYNFHRGGNASGSAAANTAVTAAITAMTNDINVIYERDLGMRLITSTNNPVLFYSNPVVSGNNLFSAGSRGDANEALKAFDQIVISGGGDNATVDAAIVAASNVTVSGIAVNSFDVGHLISAQGGGGSAYVGVSCSNFGAFGFDPIKAGGGSASGGPAGSGWVQLVAHEFGHQFGAPHSWNGGTARCGTSSSGSVIGGFCDAFGQYDPSNGYEPGAGITLMSYAGICNDHDIQEYGTTNTASSIPYIHGKSIETMRAHINSVSCDNTAVTTNNAPNFTLPTCTSNIPASTPFELSVTATDANGDAMTYSWEQTDLGAQGAPGIGAVSASAGVGVQDFTCDNSNMETTIVDVSAALNTGAPTFRSRTPTSTPTRSFPLIEKVVALAPSGNLSNTADRDGEVLPNFARNMTFRLTVRDNNGALTYDDLTLTVNANGPFTVTAPNATTVAAGATTSVTWSTGGFTGCTNVNIKLSSDGGLTYPITLASNQSYAALSAMVTIPSSLTATTNARIRVECADGNCATFYNVSGAFAITSTCAAGASNLTSATPQTFTAPPVNLGWSNTGTGNRIYSTIATSVMATLDGSDPVAPRGIATTEGGTTCIQAGNRAYEVFNFVVDQTGTYTFMQSGSTSFIASSVYTGLNAANPCSSTSFLGSTAWDVGGGTTGYAGSRGFSLTVGIQYSLVINATSGNTASVSFSGPGNVLLPSTDPGVAYSYTYVLVSDADNLIKAVSATADFGASGTFIAGTYKVYGISYLLAGANTATWVGQSIGAANGTTCLLQSSNFKALTFTTLLPVELVAFKGEVVKGNHQLSWVTASETNNAGFEVQRAKDAQEWETLGFVKGYGTTLEKQHYQFLDRQPLEGINYYRLKQIDTDGAFEYSYIISLDKKTDKSDKLVVYPNPTSETITFELGGNDLQNHTFQLIDPIGRVIKTWNGLEGTTYSFSVEDLTNGFYTIIAKSRDKVMIQRFIKQ